MKIIRILDDLTFASRLVRKVLRVETTRRLRKHEAPITLLMDGRQTNIVKEDDT